jgi:hypothetical protein
MRDLPEAAKMRGRRIRHGRAEVERGHFKAATPRELVKHAAIVEFF